MAAATARFEVIPIAAALAKLALSTSRLSTKTVLPPHRNRRTIEPNNLETAAHRLYIKSASTKPTGMIGRANGQEGQEKM
jgi:hypothetical protein